MNLYHFKNLYTGATTDVMADDETEARRLVTWNNYELTMVTHVTAIILDKGDGPGITSDKTEVVL